MLELYVAIVVTLATTGISLLIWMVQRLAAAIQDHEKRLAHIEGHLGILPGAAVLLLLGLAAAPARASEISLALDAISSNTVMEIGDVAIPAVAYDAAHGQTFEGSIFPICITYNAVEPGILWAGSLSGARPLAAANLGLALNQVTTPVLTWLVNNLGLQDHLGILQDMANYVSINGFYGYDFAADEVRWGYDGGVRVTFGGSSSSSGGSSP